MDNWYCNECNCLHPGDYICHLFLEADEPELDPAEDDPYNDDLDWVEPIW